MIKAARGRILVRIKPAIEDIKNPLGLTLVDKKKHFEHSSRRGSVESVGAGVHGVVVGDVVIFRGDAGFTMDGDPEVGERQGYGENEYRWLKEHELLAVEEVVA